LTSSEKTSTKKLLGLTGAYCAGKNHIAKLLERLGLPSLDLDKLGYEVLETEKARIVSRFGNDILADSGVINRKLLGAKVFGKPLELAALEDIIHPEVNRKTLSWIEGQSGEACVINAALLHRSVAFTMLDAIIMVESPMLTRLVRAKRRDHLPWLALLKRFHSQRSFLSQYFSGNTDIYKVKNQRLFGSDNGVLTNKSDVQLNARLKEILSCIGILVQ